MTVNELLDENDFTVLEVDLDRETIRIFDNQQQKIYILKYRWCFKPGTVLEDANNARQQVIQNYFDTNDPYRQYY